jgi:hypothetical protein
MESPWQLLNRVEQLMLYTYTTLGSPATQTANVNVLTTLDEVNLAVALGVAGKVFEALCKGSLNRSKDGGLEYSGLYYKAGIYNHFITIEGMAANRGPSNAFWKSFADFNNIMVFTIRAVKREREPTMNSELENDRAAALQRIRSLPKIYLAFREQAAYQLARKC